MTTLPCEKRRTGLVMGAQVGRFAHAHCELASRKIFGVVGSTRDALLERAAVLARSPERLSFGEGS